MRSILLFMALAGLLVLSASAQPRDQGKETAYSRQYDAYVRKGDSAYKAGDYTTGATWYLQALSIDGKRTAVLVRTACCYSMAGNTKEANEYIMQVMNQNWEQGCKVVFEKPELANYKASRYWQSIEAECAGLLEVFDVSTSRPTSGGAATPK